MPTHLNNSQARTRPPRGMTIAELMVSMAVLCVVLLLLGQMGAAAASYRQRSEAQRQVAQEANNLAERLMALPMPNLTAERAASLEEPDGDVKFKIVIDDEPDSAKLQSKRIRIRGEHRKVANVSCELLVWSHAAAGEQTK